MAGNAKTAVKLLVVGVVLAAAAVVALNLSRPTVGVRPAKRGVAQNEVYGVVKVQAEGGTRVLKTEFGGTVLSSELVRNKSVREGEVLLVLDSRPVDLEIEGKNLALAEARSALALNAEQKSSGWFAVEAAKLTLAGVEQRRITGSANADDVTTAKRNLDKANTELATEKSTREIAVKRIENEIGRLVLQKEAMTIKAPFDGTITEPLVKRNEQISPGPIALMISNTRLVQAKIDGTRYSDVKVGQDAVVTLSAYPNREFKAKVAQVATSPDPETQRYFVDLEIVGIPADELLRLLVSGLEGNALINVGQRPNAILVPIYAVNGTRVLVVKDGRVAERRVQVGYKGRFEYEIQQGLDEGDLVILDLAAKVGPGDRVKTRIVEE